MKIAYLKFCLMAGLLAVAFSAQALSSTKVTYASNAFFEKNDGGKLNPEALTKLNDLAVKLQKVNLSVIIIVGHADKSEKAPLALSLVRAEMVRRELMRLGFREEQIYTEGHSDAEPEGKAGDAINRRVEVEVVGTWKLN